MSTSDVDARARAFLALHQAARGFIMPNAWDAGSAVVLASEGFAAIGTTSAGIAFSLGKPDYNIAEPRMAVTRVETLDALARIAAAVPIPVNADLEAGYGSSPEEVAETIRLAISAGAAGGNIEDVDSGSGRLFDEDLAVARIAAARHVILASGRTFVLTARTDAIAFGGAQALQTAIRRGNRFLQAGADCIFTPGVTDPPRARVLTEGIAGPVNLVVGLNEASANARALIDAGVKRISVGGSIARAVMGLVRQGARELRDHGTVSYAAGQIPQSELNTLFIRWRNCT